MREGRVLLAALWLGLAGAAAAETPPEQTARRAAQMMQTAADRLAEAEGARDRVAALSATVQAYEEGLDALRAGIRRAALREREIRARFEARRAQISRLLGVLQALRRAQAPMLMIHPTGALGTARSGMMLSEITPALQADAEALGAQLDELRVLQALQASAASELSSGLTAVQTARAALSRAVAERTGLPRRFVADPAKLRALADSAETLEGFAETLAAAAGGAAGAPPPAGFEAARGSLPPPVPGPLLRGFGEPDAAGIRRPGIILAARPLALVTAPMAATIRYRGPLLDYGNVIILEPAADYLMVLAGLDTVYGEVGDILGAGAPLGFLGGAAPVAEEFLLAAADGGGTTERETLYIEIRHRGMPVDPQGWFALNRE